MKRIVITGASSGIGEAVAHRLGQDNKVILVARSKERLGALAASLPDALALPLDLKQPDWESHLVEAARGDEEIVLVHSAGVASFGPTAELDSEQMNDQIAVNLTAYIRASRALLPLMLEQARGHIVGVLSVSAVQPFPGASVYGASKAGALMFARCLAEEVRRSGVRITSILPGSVATPLWDSVPVDLPKQKMLTPEAVADAIAQTVEAPQDRSYDEIRIMPPEGVL